ncbi:MAG: GNAT family N-acetyltransferase [Gammaproteobacteria bacterium]|nr:GNAT family N-acetyltransferase [Gammaproteobacteria bacterium]
MIDNPMALNKTNAKIGDIKIDSFRLEDVEPFVKYWHDTSIAFWEERGVSPNITLNRKDHSERLKEKASEGTDNMCSVIFKSQRIGVHTLTHRDRHSAIMHAHFWNTEFRGLGIGPISYVKALDWFLANADLEKIIFKTPKKNIAPNRVKEKLDIPILKEVMFEGPFLKYPVPANLSEVSKKDLPALYLKLDQLYPNN